jgi:antitoxin (DNA-binding transcriptional repressor) of toxin-antitoxin stability system
MRRISTLGPPDRAPPAKALVSVVKNVTQTFMTRMSVRDIRLKWAEAERKLAAVGEIVVTRDSKPVARILPYEPRRRRTRARFDPAEHTRWLHNFWKRQPRQGSTDELLKRERAE